MSEEKEGQQIDPTQYSYREGETVEVPVEQFEMLRGFIYREASKRPPKTMLLQQKMVVEDGQIVFKDFDTNEEYKNQTPLDMRDMESFDYAFVNNLLAEQHFTNIKSGKAVHVETLKEELKKKQKSKLKKVTDQ